MVPEGIPGTLTPADTAGTAGEPRVGSRGYALPDPSTVYQRRRIQALVRISKELREWLLDADQSDPDVRSLLDDCATLIEIANSLANPIRFAIGSNSQASWAGACVLNNDKLCTWVDVNQYER